MSPTHGRALAASSLDHVRRIVKSILTASTRIESRTGLTGAQFWALSEVAREKGGLALGALARRLAFHPANAGRLVERLVTKGLVRRETHAHDARVVLVRPTPRGARLAARGVAAPAQADLLERLAALPDADARAIERALARVVEMLGASRVEPGPLFEGAPARGRRRVGRTTRPASRS
jgi:DNA-binding MarR family transcriptional regulator